MFHWIMNNTKHNKVVKNIALFQSRTVSLISILYHTDKRINNIMCTNLTLSYEVKMLCCMHNRNQA